LAKPGVFVPLDTTSIPITQTTRVESASVYVPTKVVNYEEVYTDECPQMQRSAKAGAQTIKKHRQCNVTMHLNFKCQLFCSIYQGKSNFLSLIKGISDQTILLKEKSVTAIRPKGFRKGGNTEKNQDFPRICPKVRVNLYDDC
jgi:hypothetical protein